MSLISTVRFQVPPEAYAYSSEAVTDLLHEQAAQSSRFQNFLAHPATTVTGLHFAFLEIDADRSDNVWSVLAHEPDGREQSAEPNRALGAWFEYDQVDRVELVKRVGNWVQTLALQTWEVAYTASVYENDNPRQIGCLILGRQLLRPVK